MRRAVLRGKSGDIAKVIQLADRTGIVAASAPPAGPGVHAVVLQDDDVVPAASTRGLQWMRLVSDEAETRPSTLSRVRRRALFMGAAVMCLALGWIGGGTFGNRHAEQTTPTMAVVVATEQDQPNGEEQVPAPAPVMTTKVPNPTVYVAPPPPKPRNKQTATGSPRRTSEPRASTTPSTSPHSRTPLMDTVAQPDRDTIRAALGRFQRLMKSWSIR